MAEFRHLVYTLLLVLVVLALISLADIYNLAALYVLAFAVIVAGLFWWGDRHRRHFRKR